MVGFANSPSEYNLKNKEMNNYKKAIERNEVRDFSLAMVSIITMIAIGELMYRITDCITVLQHTQIFVSNSRIKQINTSLQTKSKQNI